MKNLFKNLMLVAVAAMAFTACTETNDEVNAVVEKTVLKFVAGFDEETRSGFNGETGENELGKTTYKSSWDGDEKLKVCANGDFASAQEVTLMDAEGHFEVEVLGAIPTLIDVFSPASAWSSEHYPTVPAVQTPRTNSVDPAAHILKAQGAAVESGVVTMQHQVAYGKMTVNTPAEFDIDHVEIELNGLQYHSYEGTMSYTLKATNVENNVFWFALETPMTVSSFTVTAYDANENAYTKTVDVAAAEKTLKFDQGHVSTFSVSGLEEYVEPSAPMFTSAYKSGDSNTDFYLYFTDDALGLLKLNPCAMANEDWMMILGTYQIGYNNLGNPFFYPERYSTYNGTYLDSGEVSFSVVDGQYLVQFTNLADANGVVVLESAMYLGAIEGLNIPDPREKLAVPSNVQTSVSGKTITITWGKVTGAEGYRVKLYSPYEEYFEEVVTGTEYVYNAQLANKQYSFTIMSYASDTNAQYRSSEDAYAYATTEDVDPKMELSESKLSFSADGGEKTFTVTLKNTDAAIEYTQEGDWFTVAFSGDTFTVSASANESESDAREGSIKVTAGELSQTIDVTQSKKAAQGSLDNVFTQCKYVMMLDMGIAWGRRYELTNEDGLYMDLWVDQPAANQYTGNMVADTYGYQSEWCDNDPNDRGFVVKTIYLPSKGDYVGITNATMNVTLSGDVHNITFEFTFESGDTETFTFSGTIEKAFN